METQIPDGFMLNASGHLVPEHQVREQDKLRDMVARDLAAEAVEINERLGAFKARALEAMSDLVQIAAERYDVKLGGDKGNVTATSYDGEVKVVRSHAERITFTEEIEAAKALVNQCILLWSKGANAKIQALVDRAFRTDSRGQIRTGAVLDLLRLEIDDDDWKTAMEALRDSIQTAGTVAYIRVYRRTGESEYKQIPLDLASV